MLWQGNTRRSFRLLKVLRIFEFCFLLVSCHGCCNLDTLSHRLWKVYLDRRWIFLWDRVSEWDWGGSVGKGHPSDQGNDGWSARDGWVRRRICHQTGFQFVVWACCSCKRGDLPENYYHWRNLPFYFDQLKELCFYCEMIGLVQDDFVFIDVCRRDVLCEWTVIDSDA